MTAPSKRSAQVPGVSTGTQASPSPAPTASERRRLRLRRALRRLTSKQGFMNIVPVVTTSQDGALRLLLRLLDRPRAAERMAEASPSRLPIGLLLELARGRAVAELGPGVTSATRERATEATAAQARALLRELWFAEAYFDLRLSALVSYVQLESVTVADGTRVCPRARWAASQIAHSPNSDVRASLPEFFEQVPVPDTVRAALCWRRLGLETDPEELGQITEQIHELQGERGRRLRPWQARTLMTAWENARQLEGSAALVAALMSDFSGPLATALRLDVLLDEFGMPEIESGLSPAAVWSDHPLDDPTFGPLLAQNGPVDLSQIDRWSVTLLMIWHGHLGPEFAEVLWWLLDHPSLAVRAFALEAVIAQMDAGPFAQAWTRTGPVVAPVPGGSAGPDGSAAPRAWPPVERLTRDLLEARFRGLADILVPRGYLVPWERIPGFTLDSALGASVLGGVAAIPESLIGLLDVLTGEPRARAVAALFSARPEGLDERGRVALTNALECYLEGMLEQDGEADDLELSLTGEEGRPSRGEPMLADEGVFPEDDDPENDDSAGDDPFFTPEQLIVLLADPDPRLRSAVVRVLGEV